MNELAKHKKEILKKSGLSDKDFEIVKSTLLKYVEIIPTVELKLFSKRANEIIGRIDKDDAPFIATCLARDAILWSEIKN